MNMETDMSDNREQEWLRLLDEEDTAEREVHELREELSEYEEETDEWYDVFHQLSEAENHLYYLQRCMEDFDE